MTPRPSTFLTCILLGGCVGSIDDPGPLAPPRGGPVDVTRVAADGPCIALTADERIAGASPEGDLFVDDGTTLRIVRADGTQTDAARPPGTLDFLAPESDTRATAVVSGELVRIDGALHAASTAPDADMGAARETCGGAGATGPGFLAATGGLFEHDGAQWWRWTTGDGEPIGPIDRLAPVDGACSDRSERLWLLSDGRPVAVTYGAAPSVHVIDTLPRADALVHDAAIGPVALADGSLWMGDPWARVAIDARFDAIAAGGGVLWAASGAEVHRLERGAWAHLDSALPSAAPVREIHADASGGAWIAGEGVACRRVVAPTIRVRGVLPFRAVPGGTVDLTVTAPEGAASLEVRVDGATAQSLGAPSTGTWSVSGVALAAPGWHEVSLHVTTRDGVVERAIALRVEGSGDPAMPPSWTRDVRPIAQAHCIRCHGVGTERDLTDHAAWVAGSDAIWDRLGRWETGTANAMPPTGRLDDEELDRIRRWIDGGMLP